MYISTWEDNIKMHLKEITSKDGNLIHQAKSSDRWGAVVNMIMNLLVP